MDLKLVLFALDCVPHKQLMYVVFGAIIFLMLCSFVLF